MDGTLATHVRVYCTTSRARGDQWTRFPVLPQHSPPCHEIRETQPRIHVVDRPEPTPHARRHETRTISRRVCKAKQLCMFCTPCLHFTGPCDLLESGCLDAGTNDS